jgi:hypothetical protein
MILSQTTFTELLSYEDTYIWVISGLVTTHTKKTWILNPIVCSKYDNHSRLNSEDKLGDLIWTFDEYKNIHFDKNKIMYLCELRKWGYGLDLIC